MVGEASIISAFLAGIFTIATPCIVTVLPVIIAGSIGHKLRPIFIILGFTVTFTLMGGILSAIGIIAGTIKEILRLMFIFLIIFFGSVMASEKINEFYIKISSAFSNKILRGKGFSILHKITKKHSFLNAFLLGVSVAIVWIPCITPILGSILSYASYLGNVFFGSLLLFVYSIGLGIPILVFVYSGKKILRKFKWVEKNSLRIEKFMGIIMIIIGLFILFGIDRQIQAILLPYFPDLERMLIK